MRYPTLRRDNFEWMGLRTFLGAYDDQDDSSDKHQATDYGGNRNMVLFIRSGVDGANVQNFFPMGVGETLVGECQAAENNQENSKQNSGFHRDRSGG
jgi:hypothetical protein